MASEVNPMPYKDPQKQKEFQQRWNAEHPDQLKGYSRKAEESDAVKEYRKQYRQSEIGKQNAKARHQRYLDTHGGYGEATKGYASRQSDARRSAWYKHSYGVTLEEFEAQIAAQNNLCPIGNHPFGERGKKNDSPCQDHNHETGENRAILCRRHNVGIGYFNESIAEMESAISYLRGYKK